MRAWICPRATVTKITSIDNPWGRPIEGSGGPANPKILEWRRAMISHRHHEPQKVQTSSAKAAGFDLAPQEVESQETHPTRRPPPGHRLGHGRDHGEYRRAPVAGRMDWIRHLVAAEFCCFPSLSYLPLLHRRRLNPRNPDPQFGKASLQRCDARPSARNASLLLPEACLYSSGSCSHRAGASLQSARASSHSPNASCSRGM